MRLKAVLFLTLLALALENAQANDRLYDYHEGTLDNGLRVFTMEDFSAPLVTTQVWYHVGSKDENPSRQGFAHMFEHMMFRGTDTLGPEDHFGLLRGVGGSNTNASTSFDFTYYRNAVPANQIDLALWLEAERMMYLKVDQAGFDTERAVVEEERRIGLNSPYGTLFEQVLPHLFTEHPYKWTPIGKIAHLRAAKIDELKHFWDKHYVPANASLVIVGAITHDEALAKAKQFFGWIPKLPAPAPVSIVEPETTKKIELALKERLGPIPMSAFVYRGLPQSHPDALALQMAFDLLCVGESSRIYADLVKEKKICATVENIWLALEQDGAMAIMCVSAPFGGVAPDKLFAAMDEHLQRLGAEGPADRELEKAKNQHRRAAVTRGLTIEDKAYMLGEFVITHGSPEWINQALGKIDAITAEDIKRVTAKYFAPERRIELRVEPDKNYEYDPDAGWPPTDYTPEARTFGKEGVARPADFSTAPPIQPLLENIPTPATESFTLENGLKVVVVPNNEVPFVTAMLGLKYGAWAEDSKTPGTAALTVSMLKRGTETMDAKTLAEELDFNAITLDGTATMDTATLVATSLSDKTGRALELMTGVLVHPAFPQDELDIAKKQLKTALAQQDKDPKYQAGRTLREQVFGKHPYARSATGEVKDVDALNRDHLTAWWKKFGRPDMAVLYLAGDINTETAKALTGATLATWTTEGRAAKPSVPPVSKAQRTQIYLVDSPGAVQSEIRVGQEAFDRKHPEYYKSMVFNQILGGAFTSRMNKVIRIERGLTYGARGGFQPARFTGSLSNSTFTKTETTAETVQAVLDVLKSMRDVPPTEEELNSAKQYLVGSMPFDFETPQNVVNQLWNIESNELPPDHLQRVLDGVKATTAEDVVRIATKLTDLDHLVIVVVGDAAKVKAPLEAIAPVTTVQ
ncbi:MAG: insulinase family protein [Candidatus Hydrogenedentes bacterium]|nr:insulinase family protein [Candidatus Hydrogenedentota bacterium]